VRSASPPASTTEGAGIAEASPAGERSGRGAIPGPAQDGETSTVDQSREWPFRDTAPRQDPAESRLDPIWGSDPPDSVRWHVGMSTNEETATSEGQDPQARPNQGGTTESERHSASTSTPGNATGQAGPPAAQRAGGGTSGPTSRPSDEAPSDVGWFSTGPDGGDPDAGLYRETLSKQLSAERPGHAPGQGPGSGAQPPSSVADGDAVDGPGTEGGDAVGPEGSTGRRGSSPLGESSNAGEPAAAGGHGEPSTPIGGMAVGAGEPMEIAESSGTATAAGGRTEPEQSLGSKEASEPVGPGALIAGANAAFGAGSAPGGQELRSPELIEAGMVYLDPEPEIGSPPSAAGWTERSAAGSSPQEGSSDRTGAAVPAEGRAPHPAGHVTDSVGATHGVEHLEEGPAGTALENGGEVALSAGATAIGADEAVDSGSERRGSEGRGSEGRGPGGAGQPGGLDEVVGTADAGDEVGGVARAGDPSGVGLSGEMGDIGPAATVGARGIGGSGDDEAGGAAGSSTADPPFDPAVGPTPSNEPLLPMAWPPGTAPAAREESGPPQEDEPADGGLPPQPDPSWPRLFGRSPEGDETGGAGDLSHPRDATAGPPVELDHQRGNQEAAEHPRSQREGAALESAFEPTGAAEPPSSPEDPAGEELVREELVGEEPVREQPFGSVEPVGSLEPQALRAAPGAGVAEAGPELAGGVPTGPGGPTGRSAPPGAETRRGSLQPSDEASVGIDLRATASPASGEPNKLPTSPPPGVTTGDPGTGSEQPETRRPGGGAPDDLAAGPAASPNPKGGEAAARHANISAVIRPAEAGEVDPREVPVSPRSDDVSRETSADGGEGMDPGRPDEALEDEAAIAVRDAVSRAAVEAGVDVSRETDPMAADLAIDEPIAEEMIDTESAARNARVTFRIHHDAVNGIRRVLAVANQKGGVGKSTTAVNIGAYLALAGARVLVIDLDPQGNASTGLGLDHRDIEPSIYDVLTGEAAMAAAIRATGVPNLHVLPSTIDLAGAEVELVSAMSRETRLRRALQSIDHQYDTILIDCPPSLGLLTVNALAAANELLIPIQCEYYALEGLGQLLRNVELVRANLNPELRIGGIVLTMYDGRTRLALQVVDEVRKHFTDVVYQTVVPRSVRLSEAPGYGLPIALYDPLSRGGIAYRDLTYELAERNGLLTPTGEGAS
jgi:chromosome partitioning protein